MGYGISGDVRLIGGRSGPDEKVTGNVILDVQDVEVMGNTESITRFVIKDERKKRGGKSTRTITHDFKFNTLELCKKLEGLVFDDA